MARPRLLILGGTTEARGLAAALSERGEFDILLSLAGRTERPAPQPVPIRVGGFGGVEGLAAFLKDGGYAMLIDATHPFAERISANAALAAKAVGIPVLALRRPQWQSQPGDRWRMAADMAGAIEALGSPHRRVLLATGRQGAFHAEAAPQHFYLVRSVDPVEPPLALPQVHYLLERGPFDFESEMALLRNHRIDAVIAKNSGGAATYAKIEAARALQIEVLMIARAVAPSVMTVDTTDAALAAIDHLFPPAMKRGV